MANDPKQNQEDEYLFSEDANADTLNTTESPTQSPTPVTASNNVLVLWRKNLMVGLALLIIIFVVYKVVGALFSTKEVKTMPNINAVQSQIAAMNASGNTPNNTPSQPLVTTSSALHDSINVYHENHASDQQLAKLSVTSQTMRVDIDNLNNATQSLQTSMDNISSQLTQLNATLSVLANKVQIQDDRWIAAHQKIKSKRKAAPIINSETYYVLAIVPGRAWLQSTNGTTITVGQGMDVPGYGKVVAIDPQLGQVSMSSGKMIMFSPSDQ